MSDFLSTHQVIGTAARARDAAGRLLLGLAAHNNADGWPDVERQRLVSEIETAQNALAMALQAMGVGQ